MENLAQEFIAKLRAHGHRAYVEKSGKLGSCCTSANQPRRPSLAKCSISTLSPTWRLRKPEIRIAALIVATREADAHEDHVAGTDR
jgi:hypothetical protein